MTWLEKLASEIRVGDIIIRNVVKTREFEDDAPYGAFFVERVETFSGALFMTVTKTCDIKHDTKARDKEKTFVIYRNTNEVVTYAEQEKGE